MELILGDKTGTINLIGLVLAGGLSTRMGQCKAYCHPFGSNGPTMLEAAFRLAHSVTPVCFVSCARGKTFANFPCLEDPDGYPVAGPALGILTGLREGAKRKAAAILAIACDLPCLTETLLQRLVMEHQARKLSATFYQCARTGKVEMLAGIYGVELLPGMAAQMRKGQASLFRLVPDNLRHLLPYGPEAERFFLNCNRPQDLASLQMSPHNPRLANLPQGPGQPGPESYGAF